MLNKVHHHITVQQLALLLSRPSKIRSNAVIVVEWFSGSVCQLSNGQFLYLYFRLDVHLQGVCDVTNRDVTGV